MNVVIIGDGAIGRKRAAAIEAAGDVIVGRIDVGDVLRAGADVAVVATTHDALMPRAIEALQAGVDVLIEKPGARSVAELDEIIAAAQLYDRRVRVGFNHRYHPALQQAKAIVDAGSIGPLMFIRGRYGHGGRLGYEHEWRSDPIRAGGGETLDQGVHLIDLARWFLGEFVIVQGHTSRYFWDRPYDDNGFLSLRTRSGQTAWLAVSCTEWKNLFSLEIYGRDGKLQVDGLGGSYGVERLTYYKMLPAMGPPETTIWEYPGLDPSWAVEWAAFMDDIRLTRSPDPGLLDARAALAIVESV